MSRFSVNCLRFIALVACLLLMTEIWARAVQASLDRDTVFEGETVVLTIESATRFPHDSPDLNPLLKDFRILHTSTSKALTTQWMIWLEPKRNGDIIVPPLRIGLQKTASLNLLVKSSTNRGGIEAIFLEADIAPQNPYVHSQIRYTLRLLFTGQLQRGVFSELAVDGAVVERLGEDISYETTRDGRRYEIIERRYAIFPERSGELKIPTVDFQGRAIFKHSTAAGKNGANHRGRNVYLSTEPTVLKVRPRAAAFSGSHWLPSEELILLESWPKQALRVGEPVTRTIMIEAKGLAANQLPTLKVSDIPQGRVYPDRPVTDTRIDGAWVVGHWEQRMAVVPTRAGEFTLPEIRLVWWDTLQDKEQVAVLPARTITVLPAAGEAAPVLSQTEQKAESVRMVLGSPLGSSLGATGFWPWISAALLVLWLATLIGWWRERRGKTTKAAEQKPIGASESRRALRQACRNNDAQGAAKALLDWAAEVLPAPAPKNLGALAARLASDGEPIWELDRALYAGLSSSWDGSLLWQAVQQGLADKRDSGSPQESGLPPLYPRRSQ